MLRLNEQYGVNPGSEAALGSALLDGIRDLDEREYGSSIKPYCKRFLEVSAELPYEILRRGAKLLVEQLHNEAFVFQRECLHDPALVERLEPGDRAELAAVVVSALEAASDSGASGSLRRVADLMELLGLLEAELSEAQINQLKAAITTVLESGPDAFSLANLAFAVVRADVDLPPDFYAALFDHDRQCSAHAIDGAFIVVGRVSRRATFTVDRGGTARTFFTLTDPAEVASRVPVLRSCRPG